MDAQQRQDIVERFNTDEDFRRRVLEDANGAVKQEFGVDLPFPARVVAEGEGYRIEPAGGASSDLSDEQLELVAGGWGKGGRVDPRIPPQKITTHTGRIEKFPT